MPGPEPTCPGDAEIERLADGDTSAPGLLGHIENCPACSARLQAARHDAAFLERVRELALPALGPEGAPRIPGYRTDHIISAGAQGVVYRAVQEATSRTVAIKTLVVGDAASARQKLRAAREAEIVARLRHPNIVTVFESRPLPGGQIAVVMEYVDGVPLDQWTPPELSPAQRQREVLRVFIAVCNGIHHAHLNGVIHRDLKPDNILVTAEGRPVVLDFGIAKARGAEGIRTTWTGEFAGTPAYASPEQVSGHAENVDALTDVYSLGVILYRLLCGSMPYDLDGSILEIARTIAETEPVHPRRRVPALSPDLEAVILRAIRKEKDRRYQSAAALARDIERFLSGHPVEARSGSGWYMLRKAVALNKRRLAWAGAALVLLGGAAVVVTISLATAAESDRRAELQREQARAEAVRARAVTELLREALPGADADHPAFASAVGGGLWRLYVRLETGAFADDPEVDQTLRRLWGTLYTGLGGGKASGLVEYAEVSLRNGLMRLRQQHAQDHPEIASTMHELAAVLLFRKRAPEAERYGREALDMRTRLAGPDAFPVAESRALLARILLDLGKPDEAGRQADQALVTFRSLPDAEADLLIASMTALKARVSFEQADAAGCEPLLRDSLTRRLRRLPPNDPELLASLAEAAALADLAPECELVRVLAAAWGSTPATIQADVRRDRVLLGASDSIPFVNIAPAGRSDAIGRLLRLDEALLGPDDPALVGVLLAQMHAAESQGPSSFGVRAAAAMRAADILARRFGPDDLSVLLCVEQAATICAYAGRSDQAVELARRARGIWDHVPASTRDALFAANCTRRLGWCLSLAGRNEEAIATLWLAIAELKQAVGERHHTLALAQSNLALCLADTGNLPEADELSLRALELAQAFPATPEDQIAHIRFARGHVLTLLRRDAEASQILQSAWSPHYEFAGPWFPWRHTLIHDLAAVCERSGDPSAAALWRSRLENDPAEASRP